VIEASALLSIFIWLRWYSGFWRHGWVGLCFGLALNLAVLQGTPAQQAIAVHYEIPRRLYAAGTIVFTLMGIGELRNFVMASKADDGFWGVSTLALALAQGIIFVRLSRSEKPGTLTVPKTIHHG